MDNPPNEADMRMTKRIFQALKNKKDSEEFHDVVVVAGKSEFKCNRVILASVSEFFSGLFRSGMKECLESRVTLKSISGDVFSQILDCIYSGRSILTTENIFDIWAAADILDASFLLEECQIFFKDNLSVENCIEYCVHLRLLNEEFKIKALKCLAKNFKRFRYKEHLFKLTFDEMKYLVSSNALVTFCEDDVIRTILRWAECTPTLGGLSDTLPLEKGVSAVSLEVNVTSLKAQSANDGNATEETISQALEEQAEEVPVPRSEQLADLLECSRYLLTSYGFLVDTLSCHPLVKGNARCLALVDKISRYLVNTGLQQEWCPPEAIHRGGENVSNVFLLYDRRGKASVVYPPEAHCYQREDASMNLDRSSFEAVSGIFYYVGSLLVLDSNNNLSLHTPDADSWYTKTIVKGWERQKTVLIGESLYLFKENTEDKPTYIYKLKLSDIINPYTHPYEWQPVCQLMVKGLSLKAATSIGNKVIMFWAGAREAGFTVECCDLFQLKYSELKNQMGSMSDLVTFRRDNEVFALQTNGALWRISLCPSSDKLVFTQECQLWADTVVKLYGAFLYGTYLNILGESRADMSYVTNIALHGVFKNIRFHNSKFCYYVHAVLSKDLLEKK
ncbi:kelch repeat and BTB domain-containing protein 12 [Plakobranchus ocellatus]|uniref:Kelch repeat and BTB domain-containing protein 12 n=1 Tax=Plakobranchus ocellatus TaxID=259542 RepID=A0AAV4CKU3_9GAST|nr:kelch repeat and BTB domain-containing protein 12 [Plakobranchus ocellatus]